MDKKSPLQELLSAFAAREGMTKRRAEVFTRAFFDVIQEALLSDKYVKIKGFGTFKLVAVGERESIDVNTGERIQISGHTKVTFTPDNSLKDIINRPFSQFQTVVINEGTDLSELERMDLPTGLPPMPIEADDDMDDMVSTETSMMTADAQTDEEDETTVSETVEISSSTTSSPTFTDGHETAPDNHAESPNENLDDGRIHSQDLPHEKKEEVHPARRADEHLNPSSPEESETDEIARHPQTASIPSDKGEDSPKVSTHIQGTEELTDTTGSNKELHGSAHDECPQDERNGSTATTSVGHPSEDAHPDMAQTTPDNSHIANKPITDGCLSLHNNSRAEEPPGDMPCPAQSSPAPKSKNTCDGTNGWKVTAIIIGILFLMFLSYFAGYFRLFCPCEQLDAWQKRLMSSPATPATPTSSTVQITPAPLPPTDSIQAASPETGVNVAFSPNQPAASRKEKSVENTESAPPMSTSVRSSSTPQKPTKRKRATAGTHAKSKYIAVGTRDTHIIAPGETLRSIAEDEYGSKGYAHYIADYNHITNPDLISVGDEIKLPELRPNPNYNP